MTHPTTAQKPVAEIYNVTGGLISKHQLKGIDNNIDVSMLSNGFYLIKVKTQSQVVQQKLQIIK